MQSEHFTANATRIKIAFVFANGDGTIPTRSVLSASSIEKLSTTLSLPKHGGKENLAAPQTIIELVGGSKYAVMAECVLGYLFLAFFVVVLPTS